MTAPKPHDPLADLREPAPAVGTLPVVAEPDPAEPEQEQAAETTPGRYDTLWHDDATARVVERWHGDQTAVAHLHGGGNCGCRYIASMALLEAVGIDLRAEVIDDDGDGGS